MFKTNVTDIGQVADLLSRTASLFKEGDPDKANLTALSQAIMGSKRVAGALLAAVMTGGKDIDIAPGSSEPEYVQTFKAAFLYVARLDEDDPSRPIQNMNLILFGIAAKALAEEFHGEKTGKMFAMSLNVEDERVEILFLAQDANTIAKYVGKFVDAAKKFDLDLHVETRD